MAPSLSLALACIVTFAPCVKLALLAGLVMLIDGALFGCSTVIVTAVEVADVDLLSVARAVSGYVPGFTLLHVKEEGLERSSPSLVVPLETASLVMAPSGALGVAVSVMFPALRAALLAGLVSFTVGASWSGPFA